MARDDEGDGISSQSLPNRLGFGRLAQSLGKLAVGPGLTRRDFSSGLVHLSVERIRSVQFNGDVAKILGVALEMLA